MDDVYGAVDVEINLGGRRNRFTFCIIIKGRDRHTKEVAVSENEISYWS